MLMTIWAWMTTKRGSACTNQHGLFEGHINIKQRHWIVKKRTAVSSSIVKKADVKMLSINDRFNTGVLRVVRSKKECHLIYGEGSCLMSSTHFAVARRYISTIRRCSCCLNGSTLEQIPHMSNGFRLCCMSHLVERHTDYLIKQRQYIMYTHGWSI